MIFPTLQGTPCRYINLNEAAMRWTQRQQKSFQAKENPLLEPACCARMVEDTHKQFGIAYSWGGYFEDRSFIWRGSYLEKDERFIHLGVDLNAPAGTKVAVDFDATIVHIDDDHPEPHGWGPRVILKHEGQNAYLIYAHLDHPLSRGLRVGSILRRGACFASIGLAPRNGNWYPHVHVQAMSPDSYAIARQCKFSSDALDGYASEDTPVLRSLFPNPTEYIHER